MFGKFFNTNDKESEGLLTFRIADFNFEVDKPSWWNEVSIKFDEEELAQSSDVNQFAARLNNGSLQKAMKAHYAYNQVKKEIPYELANLARSFGDPKLDLQITKGILTYKTDVNPNEGETLSPLYFNMANALYELNEPELAKKCYQEAAVSVQQPGVDSYHDYIVKKAKEKLDYFESFENDQALQQHLLSFRDSIDTRASMLKDPEKLSEIKEKLNGFMWTVTLDELKPEQLALIDLIYDDFQSGEGKIITAEIVGEVKQTLKDYHEGAETYFDINISGIFFPESLSNKWELQFDGKGYEIVHVTFDRWQMTDVSLSD